MRLTRVQRFVTLVTAASFSLIALGGAEAAGWGATEEVTQTVSAGAVKLALAAPGTDAAFTPDPVDNLAPGVDVARYVDLTNTGSLSLGALTFTATKGAQDPTTGSGAPDLFGADGLRISLERCGTTAVPATFIPTTGACSISGSGSGSGADAGTITSILAATDVSTLATTPAVLPAEQAPVQIESTVSLRIVFALPGDAPAEYQGITASTVLTFRAEQREAGNYVGNPGDS